MGRFACLISRRSDSVVLTVDAFPVAAEHPDLIELTGIVDRSVGRAEIRAVATCDTAGMLASGQFLNKAVRNIDSYDAFFRDALEPWQEAITAVRDRVEELLDSSSAYPNR